MRVSEQSFASQQRITNVKAEISRTLLRMCQELPELTDCEIALALSDSVGYQLTSLYRAEMSSKESKR